MLGYSPIFIDFGVDRPVQAECTCDWGHTCYKPFKPVGASQWYYLVQLLICFEYRYIVRSPISVHVYIYKYQVHQLYISKLQNSLTENKPDAFNCHVVLNYQIKAAQYGSCYLYQQ